MKKTWILIADAHRARCFERSGAGQPLTELSDFLHPKPTLASIAEGSDLTAAAGKGHGRTAHAGTQFEPHTEAHAKERASFAHQLAHYLNEGVAEQRCGALVLIATSPMLGEIKPLLSPIAEKALQRTISSDLTHYVGSDLKERVDHALKLPD